MDLLLSFCGNDRNDKMKYQVCRNSFKKILNEKIFTKGQRLVLDKALGKQIQQ